ncbi:MAG: hypothetical protein LBK59_02450 [Bifidobacteriaceae bacterium]|jgi:hypothetical protein|nr:hypothetical protein [Bifidobacteriaceae bacterium]
MWTVQLCNLTGAAQRIEAERAEQKQLQHPARRARQFSDPSERDPCRADPGRDGPARNMGHLRQVRANAEAGRSMAVNELIDI